MGNKWDEFWPKKRIKNSCCSLYRQGTVHMDGGEESGVYNSVPPQKIGCFLYLTASSKVSERAMPEHNSKNDSVIWLGPR